MKKRSRIFRIVLFLIIVTSKSSLLGQSKFNALLKTQLDSILIEDQKYRPVFMAMITPAGSDSLAAYYKMPIKKVDSLFSFLMGQNDSANLAFIENAIAKYGYAGKSIVGEPTNEAMWYVIQHSEKIGNYFGIIEKAGKEKELPMRLVAMMQDRLLVEQNKKQIYGTQIARRKIKNEKEETMFVWPIEQPESVNKRRKGAGFETTVEQNAQRFSIEYKIVKMEDIQPLERK